MKVFHSRVFHSFEEAEKYADKNCFKGTYDIEETRNGNFRIANKTLENSPKSEFSSLYASAKLPL